MYEELIKYINNEDLESAVSTLNTYDLSEIDEALAVIVASLYVEIGMLEEAEEIIQRGLQLNPENYELYLILGRVYMYSNINLAYLCFENAEFFCTDEADLRVILEFKNMAMEQPNYSVNQLAYVILSYNSLSYTKQCIESIREHNLSSSYEIIVVDNASTDGSVEWLKAQEDIKLLCNEENVGFPCGCNQGVKMASPNADILFLNNDTIVYRNSIFNLRMGLYSSENVGAAGSVTNHCGSQQQIQCDCVTDEDYKAYAEEQNVVGRQRYEQAVLLIGYALLVKRETLDLVGLFDTAFTPGQFEDNDLVLRIMTVGKQCIICHNSFIRHYGSGGGKNLVFWRDKMQKNRQYLKRKWGFDMPYYSYARNSLVDFLQENKYASFSVLEVGCGLGATLSKIQYHYPNSKVYGVELVPEVVRVAEKRHDIIQGNIETMDLPYEFGSFDYIFLGDVLEHLSEPEEILKKLISYLKEDGSFICSIPNVMHVSVLYPLLSGKFEYQDAGVLDKTHLRFFTLDSIVKMFYNVGFKIENLRYTSDGAEELPRYQEFVKWLLSREGAVSEKQYWAYQYIFRATKY